MPRLSIYLLGSFLAAFEEINKPVSFRTEKERALLAFLAVESDRGHTRDVLAEMFWPDRPEGIARTNLRQALAGIRQAVGDRDSDTPFLVVTDETIRFNPARPHWLDTQAFNRILQQVNSHEHAAIFHCTPCIALLKEAAELYRGDFVDEFSLPTSQQFLEWKAFYREHFFRQYITALEHTSDYHIFRKEFDQAYSLAWKQVHLAPLEEKAHRRMMRILSLNRRRSAAIEQYYACRRILRDELGVEPSPETIRLFEQIRAGRPLDVEQPARQPEPVPVPLTPFFGREEEFEWFSRCLPNPVCRLLTLVGMAGVGKSRLALEAARRFEANFPDGIYFAQLDLTYRQDHLQATIANALGLQHQLSGDTGHNILKTLAGRNALLVIDGFEPCLSETDFLLEVLRSADELKILLTSRQKLNYQAACYLNVHGLPFPDMAGSPDAQLSPAVRLFSARAERMRAGFKASRDNLPQIIEICRLAGGNPLAIELAAARVREFDLAEIVGGMRSNLDILSTTQRDVPSVHRSMTAAFTPSWERLGEDEQALLSRLSVFPSRFSIQSASHVAGASLAQLTSLADQSFLAGDATEGYELYPLVRQFAAAQLALDPDEKARLSVALQKLDGLPAAGGPVRLESEGGEARGRDSTGLPLPAVDRRHVTRDPLTRLPNRLVFEDRLDHALALAARESRAIAVLIVDLSKKEVSGYDPGGTGPLRLLPAIALQIKATIRESDTLARISELTFGLILHTLQEPGDALRVAEKIYREIDRFYLVSGRTRTSPVQIGVSLFPQDGADGISLLEAAAAAGKRVSAEDEIPVRFYSSNPDLEKE